MVEAKSTSGLSGFVVAMYYGREDIAEILLAKAPELDVHEASIASRMRRLKELVSPNQSLVHSYSADGFTPLGLAAFFGRKEIVEFLLAQGAAVNAPVRNEMGYTALTGAVSRGHREIAELLLAKGADVNHRYSGGLTSLAEPAFHGDVEMVRLLLANGADVNARTDDGKTPLTFALEGGHGDVADLLRQHGGT